MNPSTRSNTKIAPRFPRLQFLMKKREDDAKQLRFYADEDFLLHVVPGKR